MADHDTPAGGTFLNATQLLVSQHAIAAAKAPRSSTRDQLDQFSKLEGPGNQDADSRVYVDWRKRPELGYIVNEALKR